MSCVIFCVLLPSHSALSTPLDVAIFISEYFSWFCKWGISIHVPVRRDAKCYVLHKVMWSLKVLKSSFKGGQPQQEARYFWKAENQIISPFSPWCLSPVTVSWRWMQFSGPTSFCGRSLSDEQGFANRLCIPVNKLSGDESSNLASRGSKGDRFWHARPLLVAPYVPTNMIPCKTDPQAIEAQLHTQMWIGECLALVFLERCYYGTNCLWVHICVVCSVKLIVDLK